MTFGLLYWGYLSELAFKLVLLYTVPQMLHLFIFMQPEPEPDVGSGSECLPV